MSELVPKDEIEKIVGVARKDYHVARAVSAEQTVYILHSTACIESGRDLRECIYSQAMDHGFAPELWIEAEDIPVEIDVCLCGCQRLVPVNRVAEEEP